MNIVPYWLCDKCLHCDQRVCLYPFFGAGGIGVYL